MPASQTVAIELRGLPATEKLGRGGGTSGPFGMIDSLLRRRGSPHCYGFACTW
jgi:hypothetical protein